jgi:hypothetical protein
VLYNKLPTPTSSSAQKAQKLKKEIVQLKRELGNTSPQDNFSRWAKLDRQHNKAMAEFQKIGMFALLVYSRHPSFANKSLYRWLPPHPPSDLYVRRLHPSLAGYPRPSFRVTILVRKIAHVLDARRLVAILC